MYKKHFQTVILINNQVLNSIRRNNLGGKIYKKTIRFHKTVIIISQLGTECTY